MMMMRLAIAAALLPAVTAAPTCTEESCCVPMVQGMCSGNTHDLSGKKPTDVGYTASEVTAVTCSGATPENKGPTVSGRDAATCCQAETPTSTPARGTCGDKDGDGTGTAAVSGTDCGAGWMLKPNSASLQCVGTACDMNLEDDKLQCCTMCALGEFALEADATCTAHADCADGEGYSGNTVTTFDAATHCTQCAAGKFAAAGHNTCEDCAAGQYSAAGATSCINCGAGQFAATAGASACTAVATAQSTPPAVTTCPEGKGFVAASTTADAHCVDCVVGTNWNNANDNSQCIGVTTTCSNAGEGLTVSTDATADSTCSACPENTYAGINDDTCKTDCADGFVIMDANSAVATTGGATCTPCSGGTFDHDGIPSTQCQAIATAQSTPPAVTTCPEGKGFVAASTTADAHCVDCVAGTNFNNANDNTACVPITAFDCAAGKGYASDATATTDDTSAACTACTAGKFSAGDQAVCADCAAGTWSAAGAQSCTTCEAGTTVAAGAGTAATDCVARKEYCLEASADDDTDTDDDGQPYACPAGKWVESDYLTPVVPEVLQCTTVKATGSAITAVPTTCTPVLAEAAVTGVTGDTGIVLTGPDTDAVTPVTPVDAIPASCTQSTGSGGSCILAEPVALSGGEATTCPEPVVEDKTTAGAATAAPLAVAAVLAAVFA